MPSLSHSRISVTSGSLIVSRWSYYFRSALRIVGGVRNWPIAFVALFRLPIRRPFFVELRVSRLRFRIRTFLDLWVVKETCLDEVYEHDLNLSEGATVVDIGAGFGDFAVYVASRHPTAIVYAVEPFPESFDLLQQNVKLNGIDNVRFFPWAVCGQSTPSLALHAPSTEALQRAIVHGAPGARSIRVQGVTLDELFERLHIDVCDWLKMDCEGAEYEILFAAGQATLARIRRMTLEVHDGFVAHDREELVRYLSQQGFEVTVRMNPVHRWLALLDASRVH